MKKIDKTLREVRRWKAKSVAKTKKMKPAEAVEYFHSVSATIKTHKKKVA